MSGTEIVGMFCLVVFAGIAGQLLGSWLINRVYDWWDGPLG
jgi:hypothetical protein